MKSKEFFVHTLVLVIVPIVVVDRGAEMKTALSDDPSPLVHALPAFGDQLGCYFTVERLKSSAETQSAFELAKPIPCAEEFETTDDLIAWIDREWEGIKIVDTPDQPKVIHLVEKQLVDRNGYVMNEQLTFTYTGTPYGLSSALGSRLQRIGPRQAGFNHQFFDDHVTKIEIDATDESVRQILTGAVTLENYSRIIWTAETALDGDQPQTVVQFSGPSVPDSDSRVK